MFERAKWYFIVLIRWDQEYHKAYWGIILANNNCRNNEELVQTRVPIDTLAEYALAIKYARGYVEYENTYTNVLSEQLQYLRKKKSPKKVILIGIVLFWGSMAAACDVASGTTPETDSALASIGAGIILAVILPLLSLVLGIVGIVIGAVYYKKSKLNGVCTNKGKATGGIVLSIIATLLSAIPVFSCLSCLSCASALNLDDSDKYTYGNDYSDSDDYDLDDYDDFEFDSEETEEFEEDFEETEGGVVDDTGI